MENNVKCPHCGYRMPLRYIPEASCRGLFVKCKGRGCGRVFEILLPVRPKPNTR